VFLDESQNDINLSVIISVTNQLSIILVSDAHKIELMCASSLPFS